MAASITRVVVVAFDVYYWLIIAHVILSWVPRRYGEPSWLVSVREFLDAITEPYLRLFRRIIPPIGAGGVGLDLSPVLGLIVLWVLRPIVAALVFRIASLVLP